MFSFCHSSPLKSGSLAAIAVDHGIGGSKAVIVHVEEFAVADHVHSCDLLVLDGGSGGNCLGVMEGLGRELAGLDGL
jgi:hypothetical protein